MYEVRPLWVSDKIGLFFYDFLPNLTKIIFLLFEATFLPKFASDLMEVKINKISFAPLLLKLLDVWSFFLFTKTLCTFLSKLKLAPLAGVAVCASL